MPAAVLPPPPVQFDMGQIELWFSQILYGLSQIDQLLLLNIPTSWMSQIDGESVSSVAV